VLKNIILSVNLKVPSYDVKETFKVNVNNFTAYNYYRLIIPIKKPNSILSIKLSEFKLFGLPNSLFYNKDTFNKIIYNTNEKQFPPASYATTPFFLIESSSSNEIFNVTPIPHYKQIITVNNLSYYIYSSTSTNSNTNYKQYLFDYNTANDATNYGSWAANQYLNGNYKTEIGATIGNNNIYKGDWIIIKFPYPIVLTKFAFWQKELVVSGTSVEKANAPIEWECYGSIDGINWNIISEASSPSTVIYYSFKYEQEVLNFNIPYLTNIS
jgi:hypothetical protein